ncbi:MAG: hypothetical protein HC906_03215 [Bacteroidales bacterium]|nr:hypothetical protein [Bacteroidales bacterium]
MWGNTALSTTVQLFMNREGTKKRIDFLPYEGSIMEAIANSEAPWIRNPSNAIETDHYSPRFLCLNLRDKTIREYWMKQWKYFIDHIGISGIFLDSSFNLSSDKFNFRQWPANEKSEHVEGRPETEPEKIIETQYFAHLDWMAEMQKMGYQYCGEDTGVFGVNRSGPGIEDRCDNLSIWPDSYCDFNERKIVEAGYEPLDIFFKGLAYRMMWRMIWNIKKDKILLGIDDQRAFHLLKIYNQVNEYLFNRTILPEEKGSCISKDNMLVLWSFADFSYNLTEKYSFVDLITIVQKKVRQ